SGSRRCGSGYERSERPTPSRGEEAARERRTVAGMNRPEHEQARTRRGPGRAGAGSGDEIYDRYLDRAIAEINALWDELAAHGDELHVPVLGSGHPLADVFLLKWAPQRSEI